MTNAGLEENDFNDIKTYGGRAALKIDLDENWTVEPTFMYQKMKANGVFFYDPELGDLNIDRFRDERSKDRFWQAALTIQGKIANFDVTYAGAYMDRPTFGINDYADYTDAYDQLYAYYGGLGYFYFNDAAGNPLANPQQFIEGTNHFKKLSQEIRIASPADQPFRVIAGAFLPAADQFHPPGLQGRRARPRIVGERLAWNALADPAEAQGQGLCAVWRSQLGCHAADHADRRWAPVQVRQYV